MITLSSLLSVIESTKVITVNLYDENNLLLITFDLPGYACLEDALEERQVAKLKINNLTNIDVILAAE